MNEKAYKGISTIYVLVPILVAIMLGAVALPRAGYRRGVLTPYRVTGEKGQDGEEYYTLRGPDGQLITDSHGEREVHLHHPNGSGNTYQDPHDLPLVVLVWVGGVPCYRHPENKTTLHAIPDTDSVFL